MLVGIAVLPNLAAAAPVQPPAATAVAPLFVQAEILERRDGEFTPTTTSTSTFPWRLDCTGNVNSVSTAKFHSKTKFPGN
jgi:hypothetical protein